MATGEKILILDPKKAGEPQQWEAPWRVAVVAFVYAPTGLSAGKVRNFLSRDDESVGQLADYAEKTAQTEALISALSSPTSSAAVVQSAPQGFSPQYGVNVQIDRTAFVGATGYGSVPGAEFRKSPAMTRSRRKGRSRRARLPA